MFFKKREEKLIVYKFKVGDVLRHKASGVKVVVLFVGKCYKYDYSYLGYTLSSKYDEYSEIEKEMAEIMYLL